MICIKRKLVHKSLEEIACEQVCLNSSEIFSIEFENQKYWVKKARQTKPNKIQSLFYKFLPFELLMPSLEKSAKEALEHETAKLELFRNNGINVPKVVYKCDEFFILEDVGETLNTLTRNRAISEEKMYYYVDKLLEELSKIHNNNLFHGGAQTRNFTYQDGKVYAIDLEESFDKSIDIKVLQFRDVLLLLLSLVKIKANFDLDYTYIINKYIEQTGSIEIVSKLKKLAGKISFLIYLSDLSFIHKLLGSDVKGFFKLFKILQKL